MKSKLWFVTVAVLIGVLLWLPSCARASVDLVAGSSHIANIVADLSDGRLKTRVLIPPGACPGTYDIKPGDIEALTKSKALLIHDYQQNMKNVTGAIEAARSPNLVIKVISVTGNWMVPSVQAEGVTKIAEVLAELDRENAALYRQRADERKKAVLAKGEEVKKRLQAANVGQVKVICAEKQAGFVKWAGFDVVATYGRPEELSVSQVAELVAKARQAGVVLVIDNLQSGATATSEAMAKDIGAVQVTISNFPGGLKGTESWEKALDRNVELLFEALAKVKK